jgi:NAD(P) transhydrogenase
MFVMGGGYLPGTIPQALGAMAVLLATINVSGGFIVSKRMLDMFKRKSSNNHCAFPYPWYRPH